MTEFDEDEDEQEIDDESEEFIAGSLSRLASGDIIIFQFI